MRGKFFLKVKAAIHQELDVEFQAAVGIRFQEAQCEAPNTGKEVNDGQYFAHRHD
jgi:hypothetical protein